MLKTFVDQAELLKYEPKLTDYLATGQSDFLDIIASSLEVLTQDLKQNKLELKMLGTPLSLHSSGGEITSKTGDKTTEDFIERRLLSIDQTIVSGISVFTLQGTNDSSSETWTDVKTVTFIGNEVAQRNNLFDNVFKFYRLNYSGTSSTYSADLFEESFQIVHIYLALFMIFATLKHQVDSIWEEKAVDYKQRYEDKLKSLVFSIDSDLSGNISIGEVGEIIRPGFSR